MALGFHGRAAIHPGHVDTIVSVFTPSDDEVTRACDLIDEFDEQDAAAVVSSRTGQVLEEPVVVALLETLRRYDSAAQKSRQHK